MKMHPKRRRTAQGGFTLLELLVAIMVLALIMTAAMGAVRMGSRSFEAGVLSADETAEIRAISRVLRRQFRQLLRHTWSENDHDYIAFDGDRSAVQFIAPGPDSSTGPGYLVYRLATETSRESPSLIMEFAPFDPGSEGFDRPDYSRRERLSNDLQVRFDYFGALDELSQPQWHDEWHANSARLPKVVRMRLTTSGQPWPDLLYQVQFEDGQ